MTAEPSFSARPAAPIRTRGPVDTPDPAYPAVPPEHPTAPPRGQPPSAVFSRRWPMTSVALVSAHGDIDATNAATLTEYALTDVARCQGLVLDLRGLDSCGAEGFVALHRISVRCAGAGTAWVIVSGPAVFRLLAVSDPVGALPRASTMNAALTSIQQQCHLTHPRGVPT